MIRDWDSVPTLNTEVDFADLSVTLSATQTAILARVNGLASLGIIRESLGVSISAMEDAVEHLVALDLIRLPSYAPIPEEPRRRKRAEPARTVREPSRPEESAEQLIGKPWTPDDAAKIIGETHRERRSGVLRFVTTGGRCKSLYFEHGDLLQVTSRPFNPGECLGRILQRVGRIEEDEVLRSLELHKAKGILQGDALIELGVLGPQEVRKYLGIQVELKLGELLNWTGGIWTFTDVENLREHFRPAEIRLPRLIFNVYWKNYDYLPAEERREDVERTYIGLPDIPYFPVHELRIAPHVDRIWNSIRVADVEYRNIAITMRISTQQLFRIVWTLYVCGFIDFFASPRLRDSGGVIRTA